MKFYIIGDSFAAPPTEDLIPKDKNLKDCYWVEILKNYFNESKFYINSAPSRDVQTIIDIWIKFIPKLSVDDFVILMLPYLSRTRLPIKNPTYHFDENQNIIHVERFVGTHSYTPKMYNIEFWDENISPEEINQLLIPQEIINQSDSSYYNLFEIIDSLINISKSKTLIFSWDDMRIKSKNIIDKKEIIENIGYWETFVDLYEKSDGKDGFKNDSHWSYDYHVQFGKYVLNKILNF